MTVEVLAGMGFYLGAGLTLEKEIAC